MGKREDPMVRFFRKVGVGDDKTGCLPWIAATNWKGYGKFWYRGRWVAAHRWAYEFYRGKIPAGLHCLHKCDNPCCVNPDHLFLGTNKDNVEDKLRKGRQACGERIPQAKLTEPQVLAIRADKRLQKEIAEDYGISQPLVSLIKSRLIWTHI